HLYDMYCVEQDDGNWTPSYIFNDNQNTSKNEILQSFNGEGNQVFFLKSESSDLVKADLMTDIFSSDFDEKEPPSRVVTTIRSDLGDKDIFVYNDSLYLFSSKRKGGYGGYDI
ncbi:MAG TPA: hypothetical protein PKD85_07460, partial [Saprospiraceae bacterium]|nr:hypothetical protein [Saprospiraceae bacterium]